MAHRYAIRVDGLHVPRICQRGYSAPLPNPCARFLILLGYAYFSRLEPVADNKSCSHIMDD
jgi:hypothetical protein